MKLYLIKRLHYYPDVYVFLMGFNPETGAPIWRGDIELSQSYCDKTANAVLKDLNNRFRWSKHYIEEIQ